MDFTQEQAKAVRSRLEVYALANGATATELLESRNALGEGKALRKHIERVERALGRAYATLSAPLQNVLESCRAVAGALAFTRQPWQWDQLDREIWSVVLEAVR